MVRSWSAAPRRGRITAATAALVDSPASGHSGLEENRGQFAGLVGYRRRVSSRGNTVKAMKIGLARLATTLLVSGGLAGLGLGAGTALADDRYGPHQWCPGQSMEWPSGPWNQVDWDMEVCHTWYVVGIGQGNVPEHSGGPSNIWEGDTPPPPPSCAVPDVPPCMMPLPGDSIVG